MQDLNKNQPQKIFVSRDPNAHLMSKKDLKALNVVVTDYMVKNDVTVERAVINLVDSDSRFGGGFSCAEIAIIMGTSTSNIRVVEDKALNKIISPKFGMAKQLQTYMSIDESEYESDF